MEILCGTKTGFIKAKSEQGHWQVVSHALKDKEISCLIAREGVILAGTKEGVFRSDDAGSSWRDCSTGLTHKHIRWMAFHPQISDFEIVGTEPAAIFISRDGGESWNGRSEVEMLRQEWGWWLPYSPEAGCVRGFALSEAAIYAAVEVGGMLRSDDYGESWQLVRGSSGRAQVGRPAAGLLHADVHSVALHPTSAEIVFAPTGGGFFVSQDGGNTWECRYDHAYVRAVWVDPANSQRLLIGPAKNSRGHHGRIEQSLDGGQTWQQLTEPQSNNMVERFYQSGNNLFAVMSNGKLWLADTTAVDFQPILPQLPRVNAITTMNG